MTYIVDIAYEDYLQAVSTRLCGNELHWYMTPAAF